MLVEQVPFSADEQEELDENPSEAGVMINTLYMRARRIGK
jgi:hypothetical protein